jgi:hypothetical protein
MQLPPSATHPWPVGPRFLTSALGSFLLVIAIVGAGGLAAAGMTVKKPREPFRTGSFEFDLAPGWWCELEGHEYVCTPPGKEPYAAIAIMAIKERGKDDNLQAYEDHLNKPIVATDSAGKTITSTLIREGQVTLGHAKWIEALHLGSEVPNYNTYYLATNNSYLGILVTMSVHKDSEKDYIRQLNDMMATLNLYQR